MSECLETTSWDRLILSFSPQNNIYINCRNLVETSILEYLCKQILTEPHNVFNFKNLFNCWLYEKNSFIYHTCLSRENNIILCAVESLIRLTIPKWNYFKKLTLPTLSTPCFRPSEQIKFIFKLKGPGPAPEFFCCRAGFQGVDP